MAAKKTAAKKVTKRSRKTTPAKKASLPAVAKKPKRPAKANPPPAIPHRKTIVERTPKPPPKPKATITRTKAVVLADAFLKENVGKGGLYAPRMSRFRLGSIVDRGGIINICFCHEADDADPTIASLGAKCLDALVEAHPQLRAFDIEVQTIRM